METFCMPIHEINERFTKSEIYMVAWRSQEQHFHMKKMMSKHEHAGSEGSVRTRSRYGPNEIIPEGLPDKFYADTEVRDKFGKVMASPGEVNLSQVTGEEARRYMSALGMNFPEIKSTKR